LLVAHPDRYGVWNSTSEGGLKGLKLWPAFERGESFGSRYAKINELLLRLSADLEVDLWTLDALWYGYQVWVEKDLPDGRGAIEPLADQRFGLERHLHEFLRDNWSQTTLGQEWDLYSEEGDEEAGYEYPCDVGRIDLLARHKQKPCWLIIELKRNQSSDATVGQVLRYIGWVQKNLAHPNEEVRGLVIAHQADEAMLYALSAIPNVDLQLYQVEFHLLDPPHPGEKQVEEGGV